MKRSEDNGKTVEEAALGNAAQACALWREGVVGAGLTGTWGATFYDTGSGRAEVVVGRHDNTVVTRVPPAIYQWHKTAVQHAAGHEPVKAN
jgi:hypothetical protein